MGSSCNEVGCGLYRIGHQVAYIRRVTGRHGVSICCGGFSVLDGVEV